MKKSKQHNRPDGEETIRAGKHAATGEGPVAVMGLQGLSVLLPGAERATAGNRAGLSV